MLILITLFSLVEDVCPSLQLNHRVSSLASCILQLIIFDSKIRFLYFLCDAHFIFDLRILILNSRIKIFFFTKWMELIFKNGHLELNPNLKRPKLDLLSLGELLEFF